MDSRDDFNTSWLLYEMPEGISPTNLIDMITYNIRDLIKSDLSITKLTNNLFKYDSTHTMYYWYENNEKEILLGAEFTKKAHNITVTIIGKKYKGVTPYASDLYDAVLKDLKNTPIRIHSDTQLSDEGFNIWSRLLNMGHNISIYNNDKPGQSYDKIETVDDLKQYFKHDNGDFRQFQFVLSENIHSLMETTSVFNTRRMRELSGLDLGKLNKENRK